MTRAEFEEYKAGLGSCLYRGRTYRGEGWQTAPGSYYAKGYNFRSDDRNYWFISSSPEMLSNAYNFIPDEDQLKINDTAEIVPTFNGPQAENQYTFNCSDCGAPVDLETERCPKCGRRFIPTALTNKIADTIIKARAAKEGPETGRK